MTELSKGSLILSPRLLAKEYPSFHWRQGAFECNEKPADLALLAPNSSNLQPWEFLWVLESQIKESLVKACLSHAAAATAAELVVCIARTKTSDRNRRNMIDQLKEAESAGQRIPKAAWHYYLKLAPKMYYPGPAGLMGILKKLFFLFHRVETANH